MTWRASRQTKCETLPLGMSRNGSRPLGARENIRVSHDFWTQTPEKQRLILTHELLHLVLARYARVAETMEESLGKLAWAVLEPQLEDAEERATEHLARIIAPYLALPAFPKA